MPRMYLVAPLPADAPLRARLQAWMHDLSAAYAAARQARITYTAL